MILVALVLGTFMTALDATIVSVALPAISKDLYDGVTTVNISWILLAYTLALCCFILLWAKLGTNIGYRKVFIAGITIFTISSAVIGSIGLMDMSNALEFMIVMRAVQGIGAGMAMAMSLAMVSAYLPLESRGSSLAAVTLAAALGTACGPVLGGLLTAIAWPYIFFINVPIGILCLILTIVYINKNMDHVPEEKKKLDVVAAILACIMMFLFIYYLDQGGNLDGGYLGHTGIAILIGMFISGGLLIWWEQRVEDPLISLRMLKTGEIMKANIMNALIFMAMAGCYLLMPIFLQYAFLSNYDMDDGMKQIVSGLILVASSIGLLAASPLVGKVTDRTHDNKIFMVIGMLIAAAGFLMMFFYKEPDLGKSLAWVIISLIAMGFGIGMVNIASTNHAFSFIKSEESGQLSGMVNTFRQAGSSIGVAVMNAVFMIFFTKWNDITGPEKLAYGFTHAIFVAVIIAMIGFLLACSMKNKKDMVEE